MSVKLISITPDAEKIMSYCARVSNPANQDNPNVAGLLTYCIKHKHWSVFEQAHMTLEVTTGRDVAPQILRHTFKFQEFSMRYAAANEYVKRKPRRQDVKNRQNSLDDLPDADKSWFEAAQEAVWSDSYRLYTEALNRGIAKECARALLPLATKTTMYMTGSIRTFIHWIEVRTDPSTQLEHREIALEAKEIFSREIPIVAKALGWIK